MPTKGKGTKVLRKRIENGEKMSRPITFPRLADTPLPTLERLAQAITAPKKTFKEQPTKGKREKKRNADSSILKGVRITLRDRLPMKKDCLRGPSDFDWDLTTTDGVASAQSANSF